MKYKLKDVLIVNSPYHNGSNLKLRLIKEGVKEHKCEMCKRKTWNNKPVPIEMHHVNGVNTDHRLSNLQILCPNCHAQTEQYRGANQKQTTSALSERKEAEYRKFRETLTDNADGNPEPMPGYVTRVSAETRHGTPKEKTPFPQCKVCERLVKSRRSQFCSVECYREDNRKNIPKVSDIITAFEIHKSYLQVGIHFNVSDNAVRKWINFYGIESMVKV